MRRASASSSHPRRGERARQSRLFRGLLAGAAAVVLTVAAPVLAFADDEADDDSAQLKLNTSVLVNDLGGTGSSEDFAIRGALFSDQFTATVQEQEEVDAERLSAVNTLDFSEVTTSTVDYEPIRSELFVDYSPQNTLQAARDESTTSPALGGVAVVIAATAVLAIGALLGRLWARRRRATS